jgi:hypothetical protein
MSEGVGRHCNLLCGPHIAGQLKSVTANHGRVGYCSKLVSPPVSLADVPACTSRPSH